MVFYPDEVAEFRTKTNRSGVVFDEDKETVPFAEDMGFVEDEIIAIETELGALPAGDHEDVASRFDAGEIRDIAFIIDGSGSAISTGQKGHLEIPFNCEILEASLFADQSGSIVVNIWKDTYANFPPTVTVKITNTTPPTISSAVKSQNSTLTSWTKTIDAGDILAFNVDSCTTITRVTLSLKVKLTA